MDPLSFAGGVEIATVAFMLSGGFVSLWAFAKLVLW